MILIKKNVAYKLSAILLRPNVLINMAQWNQSF